MKTPKELKEDKILNELQKVNDEVKKMEKAEYMREWFKNNPEKKKQHQSKWDKENRKEYQRNYRAKKNNQ